MNENLQKRVSDSFKEKEKENGILESEIAGIKITIDSCIKLDKTERKILENHYDNSFYTSARLQFKANRKKLLSAGEHRYIADVEKWLRERENGVQKYN